MQHIEVLTLQNEDPICCIQTDIWSPVCPVDEAWHLEREPLGTMRCRASEIHGTLISFVGPFGEFRRIIQVRAREGCRTND
jgi:hypothetical protein